MGTDHSPAKPVNAALSPFNGIALTWQLSDLSAQFLDSEAGLV
jgi:hypothetical protein